MNNPLTHSKDKTNTPKDFFLWLGIIVSLYVSTVSLIVLLFEYIKILFPDPLDYVDPYNGAIRFSIASLIVLFPLYLYLTRKVNQDIRKNEEKQDIWIRRWALYLTLFIGSVTMTINAIVLINFFLDGNTTTQFILKVVALFVVIGEIFVYYWFDLKGFWRKNEKFSKIYGAIMAIIVFATVVIGFFVMGSPAEQRQFRLDEERVSDLSSIQWEILNHYQTTGVVVETLEELEDDFSYFVVPVDPESFTPYTYEKTGSLSFDLCAEFTRQSREEFTDPTYRPKYGYGFESSNWEHGAGEVCFERTIDPEQYPVREN